MSYGTHHIKTKEYWNYKISLPKVIFVGLDVTQFQSKSFNNITHLKNTCKNSMLKHINKPNYLRDFPFCFLYINNYVSRHVAAFR